MWNLNADNLRGDERVTNQDSKPEFEALSKYGRNVTDMARQGALLGLLPLWRGTAGLQATVPQPEGITVGPGGEIFIISEPNLLYRFTPNGGAQAPAAKD